MNRKLLLGLCLAIFPALLVQAADKKGKIQDKKSAEKELAQAGSLTGEIVAIDSGKSSFRLKVTLSYVVINRGAYQGILRAQADLQRAAARRDINGMRNAQNSLAQHQRNLYERKTESKEVTIEQAPEVKVRLRQPKPGFTETGEIKEYTAKELAKMRGRDRLFDGEWGDLAPKQTVVVSIVKSRTRPKPGDIKPTNLRTNKVVILSDAPPAP